MDSVNKTVAKTASSQLARLQGTKGRWICMPEREAFLASLNAEPRLKRVDSVRVTRLLYPKTPDLTVKTAIFSCGEGDESVTYKFSDDLDKMENLRTLHPAYNTWGGHVSARIGCPIDMYHTYTLWIAPQHPIMYLGKQTQLVVHIEAKPDKLDGHTLLHMVQNHPGLSETRLNYVDCEEVAKMFKFKLGPDAVDSMVELSKSWSIVVGAVPYFRELRAPLLFKLWPIKQLMNLKYKDFCALSDALEKGTLKAHCLAFDWLMPTANVDELGLAQLYTLQYALGYKDEKELMISEFFQTSLRKTKNDGHTFSSLDQLISYYVSQRSYSGQPAPTFNINTIMGMPANKPYNPTDLKAAINQHIPMAISSKIIKLRSSEGFARSIYAVDDAIKEEYVVKFLNLIITKRWDRSLHADGCDTVEEVFRKIALAAPSPNALVPGVPQWDNATFQELFASLDDDQKKAVATAVLYPLSVIYGSPGSGKTKTGQAIFYLVGGAMDCVPLAPYGRIASMWRDLLDGRGYTFHRASSLVKYASADSGEAKMLKSTTTFLNDEFSLETHHHLYMALKQFGHNVVRLVLMGDPFQMGGIGSGRFGRALYNRVVGTPIATYLSLPHRFAQGMVLPRCGADFIWTRPSSASSPMAIAWNMRQVVNFKPNQNTSLNLVYSTDINDAEARFLILPRKFSRSLGMSKDLEGLIATLKPILTALLGAALIGTGEACVRRISELGIQILTQRNQDRKAVNLAVFAIAYGEDGVKQRNDKALYIGERITFTTNAYFTSSGVVDDRELEHVNALSTAGDRNDPLLAQNQAGFANQMRQAVMDRNLMQAGLAGTPMAPRGHLKRPREEEVVTDDFRKGSSDDVFNGEIRKLARIVEISPGDGSVREVFDYTTARSVSAYTKGRGGGAAKRESRHRMLEMFDLKKDRKILNVGDYDLDKIERAYCLTDAKMQGSEDRIAIHIVTPSPYGPDGTVVNTLFNEELYMVTTRGRNRVIIVAGHDEKDGLKELHNIARVHEECARNMLVDQLELPPKTLPAVTTDADAMDLDF